MKVNDIGETIATRKLIAGNEILSVTIGKPQPFQNEGEYYCPYSIGLHNEMKFGYAIGVDSVQALQLTMKRIGVDLAYIAQEKNIPISWFPDTPGETGFP